MYNVKGTGNSSKHKRYVMRKMHFKPLEPPKRVRPSSQISLDLNIKFL